MGQRFVRITERRTMQDFAQCMKWLVDEVYPDAKIIQLVLDNLNTHKPASLYETFPPEEAQHILKKLNFHHTPKHGSWLNMAEIELSVINRRLKSHIPDEQMLMVEIQAMIEDRNSNRATVNWQFRTSDAHFKLKRLYPSISD